MAHKLTVIIPCKDEALNIRDCIESVRSVADEILVADSGSTDTTMDIARELGCRIIEREYVHSGDFKNWAIPQATNEWILLLDADERLTRELAYEINATLAAPKHSGYQINRLNHFLGHLIRFGGWYPDRPLRLFRRDIGTFIGPNDHASLELSHGSVGRLRHKFLHYTAWHYDAYLQKLIRYTHVQAHVWNDQGIQANLLQLMFRAPLRFLQTYFLKLGFLDGLPGLQLAYLTAFQSFLKQAKLWELQHGKQREDFALKPESNSLTEEATNKVA